MSALNLTTARPSSSQASGSRQAAPGVGVAAPRPSLRASAALNRPGDVTFTQHLGCVGRRQRYGELDEGPEDLCVVLDAPEQIFTAIREVGGK
jgi:hypothetical protein